MPDGIVDFLFHPGKEAKGLVAFVHI
ncbi:hypothetical protein A2U01_0013006, partial [Trifolium medium]|nr:hypothetical protein [Trifolium medium]